MRWVLGSDLFTSPIEFNENSFSDCQLKTSAVESSKSNRFANKIDSYCYEINFCITKLVLNPRLETSVLLLKSNSLLYLYEDNT